MKRALFATLCLLSACDWQAAENRARCTAGELGFCPDGGASGGGGGGTTGGGGGGGGAAAGGGGGGSVLSDAGRVDLVVPNGDTPFSLEEGPDGLVWVITTASGRLFVSQFRVDSVTLVGAFDGGPAATHADPLVSPALLLVANDGVAGTGFPDGGVGPNIRLPVPASVAVQFPTPDGGLKASFWSSASGQYRQFESPAPLLLNPTEPSPAVSCSGLELHDLALLLGDAGCCAVIGYSGSCSGGAAAGITGGSGLQVLAVDRVPFGVQVDVARARVMVGRSRQGIDVATQGTGDIAFRRYDSAVTQTDIATLTPTPGLITLGDVSDGFLTLHATGGFSVDGTAVSISRATALVVEPVARGVLPLGDAQASPRLPILALHGRVLVLWKRSGGEVVLTQLQR